MTDETKAFEKEMDLSIKELKHLTKNNSIETLESPRDATQAEEIIRGFLDCEEKCKKTGAVRTRLLHIVNRIYTICIEGGEKNGLDAIRLLLDRAYGTPMNKTQLKSESVLGTSNENGIFQINIKPVEKNKG